MEERRSETNLGRDQDLGDRRRGKGGREFSCWALVRRATMASCTTFCVVSCRHSKRGSSGISSAGQRWHPVYCFDIPGTAYRLTFFILSNSFKLRYNCLHT